ncbi:hypothetical protein [Paenibacillus sp. NPDC055715]
MINGNPLLAIGSSIGGTYIVHYNVTNPSGLAADKVTRQAVVKPIPMYYKSPPLKEGFCILTLSMATQR